MACGYVSAGRRGSNQGGLEKSTACVGWLKWRDGSEDGVCVMAWLPRVSTRAREASGRPCWNGGRTHHTITRIRECGQRWMLVAIGSKKKGMLKRGYQGVVVLQEQGMS